MLRATVVANLLKRRSMGPRLNDGVEPYPAANDVSPSPSRSLQAGGDVIPAGRGGHCCTTIGNKIFMFGGSDRLPTPYDDIWVLDTGASCLPPLSVNRPSASTSASTPCCPVAEADVFMWTKVTPPFNADHDVLSRSGASLTVVDDKLFVYGGQDPLTGLCFGDMIYFDMKLMEWRRPEVRASPCCGVRLRTRPVPPHPRRQVLVESPPPRHSHVAARIAENAILVWGGAGMLGPMSDAWVFNTATNEWTRPTISGQAPSAREMAASVMLNDHQLLVFGGRDGDNK